MNIAQDLLKELFDYKDGQLIRKVKTSNCTKVGEVIGYIDTSTGYIKASVNGKPHYIHRLIYTWFHGDIPKGLVIDHINSNKENNKIENLRLVTHQENCFNTRAKGYSWHKHSRKWKTQIKIDGKNINIGEYETESDARNAYIEAKNKYHTIQAH